MNDTPLDNPTIIATVAVIVSLCSLFLTWWQARQTVKHNKLSVKPNLTWSVYRTIKNKKLLDVSATLINAGIGPAIVRDCTMFYKGEEIAKNNSIDYENFVLDNFDGADVTWYGLATGSIIQAGEKITILKIEMKKNTKKFLETADDMDLIINYQSMYGDEIFTFNTSNLIVEEV